MPDNVIRTATSNANPVKRACGTCRHASDYLGGRYSSIARCLATNNYLDWERSWGGPCGPAGNLWEPIPPPPPRIGLVGWIKRLLFGEATP